MTVQKTPLEDLLIMEPLIFTDNRGYFFESFNEKFFKNLTGHTHCFVQDNESLSKYGTLRGLHYQTEPDAQSKLIRVIKGKIWDVAVDIRKSSPAFGRWHGVELSGENHRQFFLPRGFAHGFVVLSSEAVVQYKTDNYYSKEAERSIIFNDPMLGIDWKIPHSELILSEKDLKGESFNMADKFL